MFDNIFDDDFAGPEVDGSNTEWALDRIKEAKEKDLTVLNLQWEWQIGNPLMEIPDDVFEMRELKSLNLGGNHLTHLPEIIGKLENLTTLDLSSNQLDKDNLPDTISQLRKLNNLILRGNQISIFSEAIGKLENLIALDLSSNQLDNLPDSIAQLQKLDSLNLGGNQFSNLPETISKLENLTTLDLSANQLDTLPASISQLQKLNSLNVGANRFTVLPEILTTLKNLTSLVLSGNQLIDFPDLLIQLEKLEKLDLASTGLTSLPEIITKLRNLASLLLSHNQLTNLPQSIGKLDKLTELNLSTNTLSSLPEEISQIAGLQKLELCVNQFSSLPEWIGSLENLTWLCLRNNPLTSLPESISNLERLSTLNLSENSQDRITPSVVFHIKNLEVLDLQKKGLKKLPKEISNLRELKKLYLGNNKLKNLPDTFSELQHLSTLQLANNQFKELPEVLMGLRSLTSLDLSDNKLASQPDAIAQLEKLEKLYLRGNNIEGFPEEVANLNNLTELDLLFNPLVSPPYEVATRGIEAIRNYFRQLREEGQDRLYEAKLLILGEPGAGKTTLAKKICDKLYKLQNEESTEGVDVMNWAFPIEDQRSFRVNIWDFGGQEIDKHTHKFFLTRRSLYIVLADAREQKTDFNYWLNLVELLSGGSPLLIIMNEKQDKPWAIPESQLYGQFDNLKNILKTNLDTDRGLDAIREEIKNHIRGLPHIGNALPKTWVRVREQLEKNQHNYITLDKYLEICRENGFAETKDMMQLSSYLNDIGVSLHFNDEPLLRKYVILKPRWGTDAAYKVLNNQTVTNNLGRFTRADLESIWDAPEYEDMQYELLELMKNFKLCYEIPTQKGQYIIPQLLPEVKPDIEWEDDDNLLFRYTYEFMPKGIITDFIVAVHRYVQDHKLVWKQGIVIERDKTKAEVIELYDKKEISVRIMGMHKKELLGIVRDELAVIHKDYNDLVYSELVPCNCSSCKSRLDPHYYQFEKLREFEESNTLKIQCLNKPFQMVDVRGLMDDVFNSTPEYEETESRNPSQIFNFPNVTSFEGVTMMKKNKVSIKGSTVYGNVVAAESIKDSFNLIQNAGIKDELKEQLNQLAFAVESMLKELSEKELPEEEIEEVADYMKKLAEEAIREKPNPKWYSVSIDGLVAAAQNLGKVGDAVIELAGKVRKILTGGIL